MNTALDFGDNKMVSDAIRTKFYKKTEEINTKGSLSTLMDRIKIKKNWDLIRNPKELMKNRAPIQVFVSKGITTANLFQSGINIHEWMDHGYKISDMVELKIQWDDLICMGLDIEIAKTIPVSFMVNVLKIGISHLLHMGFTLDDLEDMNCTSIDLLALKCTTHTITNMELWNKRRAFPNFTREDWIRLSMTK